MPYTPIRITDAVVRYRNATATTAAPTSAKESEVAERLRMAMRVVRQRTRADGTVETDKDVLDWLKYVQSETTGTKLGFSTGELADLDAQFDAIWRESIEQEVNRRFAERELTLQVQQAETVIRSSSRQNNY